MAAAVPAVSLLAACGGGDDAPPPTGTSAAEPTQTRAAVPTFQVGGSGSPTATGTPDGGDSKRGGTVTVMGHQEVASLSPEDRGPTVQWVCITQIHNALLEMDENYILEPVLAEKFEAADDGLSYTFTLRTGVKFHDGSDFTSADVKYTLDYYRDEANASLIANNFRGVDSIEAPDDTTVIINMAEPNAAFIALGATTFIVPAKYHAEVGEKTYKTKPIGTGAFKLKEWIPADYTLVEAFDDHFRGRPNLDFFRLNVVPEASVRAIALETGNADSAVWPLLAEDNLKLAQMTDQFTTYRTSAVSVNHFPLNNSKPPLNDKQVRQAMMYAIDRQKLIDDIFKGTAVIATSNLSPALEFYYNPDVPKYEYDPEKAKQILDEAGWVVGPDGIREKDGVKLSFTCTVITGDQARKPEAEVVQQELQEVGIDMQIQEAPVANILDGLRNGDMEASLFNWTYGGDAGDPDGSETLRSDGGSNFSRFSNPRVDELLDQGLKEVDPEKRKEIYGEIQQIVAEEVPFLFIMYWDWFNIFSNRVKGLPASALAGDQIYRKAYQWWVED